MKFAKNGIITEGDVETYQPPRCLFCGDAVVVKNVLMTKKERSMWIKKHGCHSRSAGEIGHKHICENCLSDLINLLPE